MATDPTPHPGLFAGTLAQLHRGELLDTLDAELSAVKDAVLATGKKGKVTLTLTVSALSDDQVSVGAATSTAVPKPTRLDTLFYTDGANLVREDPRQTRLDLRSVERADKDLRRVG